MYVGSRPTTGRIVVSGTNANLLGNVGACPGAGQVCVDPTANTIFVGGLTSSLTGRRENWHLLRQVSMSAVRFLPRMVAELRLPRVAITDQRGQTVYAITNPFGYFRFTGIQPGVPIQSR